MKAVYLLIEFRCKRDKALAVRESLATLTCMHLATFLQHCRVRLALRISAGSSPVEGRYQRERRYGDSAATLPWAPWCSFLGKPRRIPRGRSSGSYLQERESGGLQVESSMQGWDDGCYVIIH